MQEDGPYAEVRDDRAPKALPHPGSFYAIDTRTHSTSSGLKRLVSYHAFHGNRSNLQESWVTRVPSRMPVRLPGTAAPACTDAILLRETLDEAARGSEQQLVEIPRFM